MWTQEREKEEDSYIFDPFKLDISTKRSKRSVLIKWKMYQLQIEFFSIIIFFVLLLLMSKSRAKRRGDVGLPQMSGRS